MLVRNDRVSSDLFNEVARAGHYTVRHHNQTLVSVALIAKRISHCRTRVQGKRKHKIPEQKEEISKKALAAFVWPRRAKTPPPSSTANGSTKRSTSRSRARHNLGTKSTEKHDLELNKSALHQKSRQPTQMQEEERPNWAAAARWLAQAHTHKKAVSSCLHLLGS